MARTVITPQKAVSAGLAVVTEPANALGNSVAQAPGRALLVTNGSAVSINVTILTPGFADADLAIPDRVVAVAAGVTKYIATSAPVYRQSDGAAYVDYSAVATVDVAVIESP